MDTVSHCYHTKGGDWQPVWTLAELSDELLQDTKVLKVEGNTPFRTGWGAKAAENQ